MMMVRRLRAFALRLRGAAPRGSMPASILGRVPPPSDDYTGVCPCGCGVRFRDGVQLEGEALAWAVADEYEASLRRIRAAALSDAQLQWSICQGLRDFLLRETWSAASDLGAADPLESAATGPRAGGSPPLNREESS
jgi:hypothetical protein